MTKVGMYLSILLAGMLFALTVTAGKRSWTQPQYGTVASPKDPSLSSRVRRGDVFTDGEHLYRALVSGDIDDWPEVFQFPGQDLAMNEAWERMSRGSYIFPYDLNDNPDILEVGAIYADKSDLFRAVCAHKQLECLQEIQEKAEWMTLLRPEIGDWPLGEIVLPGTHDSGTWGIHENSTLVDRNPGFQLGMELTPQTVSNWSLTQDSHFKDQLEAGFRTYDMRIADLESLNDTFCWWHGMAGDPIFEGLDQIAEFASSYPAEIIILEFGHFASPGDADSPTLPISDDRKDEIADILLETLGDLMAYQSLLSDNPTMNEVLETGANIITIMNDAHIRGQDDRFWTNVITGSWSGRANPEDLFEERSGRLSDHFQNHQDKITQISGCTTPNEKTITGGIIRTYGNEGWIWEIIEIIAPGVTEIDPDRMSFEGMFVDLLTKSREGTNNDGMHVRLPEFYTNGASIHYLGVNWWMKYWLARPTMYKVNGVHIDDYAYSTIVDTAILANRREILREVTVAYQGSARDGFYMWDNFTAVGGDEGHDCNTVLARYSVTSDDFQLPETFVDLDDKSQVTFLEGEYPDDAVFTLEVSTPGSDWYVLTSHNIQVMIDSNLDLYLRSSADHEQFTGFAYVSLEYDAFTDECEAVPEDDFLDLVTW